jgi:xanthine dehydrogenase small subunit
MIRFALNRSAVTTQAAPGLPLLDFLRDHAGLTGVKHACREGDCGSCAVLLGRPRDGKLNYQIVTSCLVPLGAADGCHVVTIEGLNQQQLGPVQDAMTAAGASQCGFCTPGIVVALTGHLMNTKEWKIEPAIEAIAGNICRCTGYASIRRAVEAVLDQLRGEIAIEEERIPALVRQDMLPEYFVEINDIVNNLHTEKKDRSPTRTQLVVAGGTDLYVQRPDELPTADVWVVPTGSQDPVWRDGDHLYLAGTATAEDMKVSRELDTTVGGIERAMKLMGSLPIRNRATIAGNVVNASPIGDMTIIFLALDAEVGLVRKKKRRRLPLQNFFLGYKELDLAAGEIVEWLRFPVGQKSTLFNFEKISKRTHLDIASVNSAASFRVESGRIVRAVISAGGVAPIPMRLQRTTGFLEGRRPDGETARRAAEIARGEVTPISDVRGSAEYKSLLLGQLILAHFHVLFEIDDRYLAGAAS